MGTRIATKQRREKVLDLVLKGKKNREIADILGANENTIKHDRTVVLAEYTDRSDMRLRNRAGKLIAQLETIRDELFNRFADGDPEALKYFYQAIDRLAKADGTEKFLDEMQTDAQKDTWAKAVSEAMQDADPHTP